MLNSDEMDSWSIVFFDVAMSISCSSRRTFWRICVRSERNIVSAEMCISRFGLLTDFVSEGVVLKDSQAVENIQLAIKSLNTIRNHL